jgi:hypothetical protein
MSEASSQMDNAFHPVERWLAAQAESERTTTRSIVPGKRVRILPNAPDPWGDHEGTVIWTSGQGGHLLEVRFYDSNLRSAVFAVSEAEILDP